VLDPGGEKEKVIGQIHQSPEMTSAHLNYLLWIQDSDPGGMAALLEELIRQAGHWGAKQVVADLPIESALFAPLRQAGFSVLAKQRVFRCHLPNKEEHLHGTGWRIWNHGDINAMRRLYLTLVPPLIQPIEPLTRRNRLGLVYYDENEALQAYADLVYGPRGAWVLPIIHPQIELNLTELLAQMLLDLPELNGRPIYVTIRSYQPWVENALSQLDADEGSEQALMVRYLALRQRAEPEFSFGVVESGKPEPTLPMAPIKSHHD